MRRIALIALAGTLLAIGPVHATPPTAAIQARAANLAKRLATACPVAAYNDDASFQACAQALHKIHLPFQPGIAWGGDQPEKPIKKKGLTSLNSQVFQTMYLPLFVFTGRWSIDQEPRTHAPIIRIEAFFRNALPSGDYPYPFWHSAAKWSAYETANEIRFYLDPAGNSFIATRGNAGNEVARGPYAHVTPPAFDGNWMWHDANGTMQPHVSLFSARYRPENPYLPTLDHAYRGFALQARNQACLDCHTPVNHAEADRLVLLQTPLHAAGEIDQVIKALRQEDMPQDELGLPKPIPAASRTAIIASAVTFRRELHKADAWETTHPH
jgi:hypothetical protein